MRRSLTVLFAIAGLLALSGVAAAAEEETGEEGDTVFNFGYDPVNGVFVWNTTPTDGLYDCSLEVKGELEATYSVSTDGLVYVDGLTDGSDSTVTFGPRPQEELSEGETAATEPVSYAGAEGECGLGGGSAAGPQGQVNHGMFLRLFNASFDGPTRGCVVRHIAQSDLGKGDQQVRVPDVDTEDEPVATGDTGLISFDTIVTDCLREQQEDGEGAGRPEWAGNGKPEWAGNGKPEWAGNGKPEWAGNGESENSQDGESEDAGQGKPPWAGRPGGPGGGDD